MNTIQKIREIRIAKNISQAQVAADIDMTTEGYNRLEKRGGDSITMEQIRLISNSLGVSIPEILGYSNDDKINLERISELEEGNAQYEAYVEELENRTIEHRYYFDICTNVLNAQLKERLGIDLYEIIVNKEKWYENKEQVINTINQSFRLAFLIIAGSEYMPDWWNKEHEEIINALAPYTPIENTLVIRHYTELRKKENFKRMTDRAVENGKEYLKQRNT